MFQIAFQVKSDFKLTYTIKLKTKQFTKQRGNHREKQLFPSKALDQATSISS